MWKKVEDVLPKNTKPVIVTLLSIDDKYVYEIDSFSPSNGWHLYKDIIAWCEFETYEEKKESEKMDMKNPYCVATIPCEDSFELSPTKEEEEEEKKHWFSFW